MWKLGKDIAQQPKQTTTVWHRPEHSQLPLYTKPRTPHPPPVAYLTALPVSACAKAAPWIPLNVSSPKERFQVMSNPPAWLTMSGSFVVCLSPLIHFVWFNGYVAQQLSLQPVLREGQHVSLFPFLSLSRELDEASSFRCDATRRDSFHRNPTGNAVRAGLLPCIACVQSGRIVRHQKILNKPLPK